ncbi:MAG: phage tail protein [Pseudonocardiaceae bacterium]
MTLSQLTARARPEGNQIEVTWSDPIAARVVRRRLAYPETPVPDCATEGVVVADSDPAVDAPALPDGRRRVVDTGLAAETVYYYQVFPYTGTPPAYDADPANRVSAMATGPYDFAGLLYRLLPAIYHRYDTVLPAHLFDQTEIATLDLDPADLTRGQLRRFLDLPGGQLDQIYSAVRSLLDLTDLGRVDGRLLPLRAHWIGWRTDHLLDLQRQRAEIRNAPELYRTIGTVAAVEATVLRITGWDSRTKEFVDNVVLTNRPARLNLWLARKDGESWRSGDLLSLDDAYSGRPAVVTDAAAGTVRLCYATRKAGCHDLWQKVHTSTGWAGSEPAVSRPGVDQDPAAAVQDGVLWLFWSAYDEVTHRWRIDFRIQTADRWSAIETLRADPEDSAERQSPAVLVDSSGALWLFWLERSGSGWKLRYNRNTSTPWAPTAAAAEDFPDDGGEDPRVESSVSVLFRPPQPGDPAAAFRRIGVLWSRRERVPGAPEQTRWRVVSRFKDGTDPRVVSDWGSVAVLPVADELHHDCEPSALVDGEGIVTAFWSSTRDGSWSVWEAHIDLSAYRWGTPTAVTGPPFSDRAPLAFNLAGEVALAYRSNRSVTYQSPRYQATTTTDRRYSGSTTLRTTNTAQIALRGDYDDFTAYTSDSGAAGGRTDADWYARDTVGLYLEPVTEDQAATAAGPDRLQQALPEFLPATHRAVLIPTRDREED